MDDLAVWVIGWGDNDPLAEKFRAWGVPHVFTFCDRYHGESENYNHCFRESERLGFQFILITDSDVDFRHQQTIPEMYKSIVDHSDWGSIRPWRQGENPVPYYPIEQKYMEDGTAAIWRLNTGAYCDEEFLFTGWMDYDLGNEMQYRGYKNMNDRRYPVFHNMRGSNSHSKSPILQAAKKRNKLILDVKWWVVGRENWRGVEAYNQSVPVEKRIPTFPEMLYWSPEECETFQQSVSVEHHDIWLKDGHENPNFVWLNPLICGYSTREEFERSRGYS